MKEIECEREEYVKTVNGDSKNILVVFLESCKMFWVMNGCIFVGFKKSCCLFEFRRYITFMFLTQNKFHDLLIIVTKNRS